MSTVSMKTTRWGLPLALALVLLPAPGAAGRGVAPKEPQEESEQGEGDVQLVQDVGGHNTPITALAFSSDSQRLYTIGSVPGEVIEWDVGTGTRLRVWRFPGHARRLAVSADGKLLAACGMTTVTENGRIRKAVWLVDLATGAARLGPRFPKVKPHEIAFSADGKRLALNCGPGSQTAIYDLDADTRTPMPDRMSPLQSLSFSPSGRYLLGCALRPNGDTPALRLWDVSKKGAPAAVPLSAGGPASVAAWSPDSSRFATLWGASFSSTLAPAWPKEQAARSSVRIWSMGETPKLLWHIDHARLVKDLKVTWKGEWAGIAVHFLSLTELVACWDVGGALLIAHIDTQKQQITPLSSAIPNQFEQGGLVAFSANGRWLAATTDPASQVVLYDLQKREQVRKLGPPGELPRVVGWAADGYGVAWGYKPRAETDWQKGLQVGLDLKGPEALSRGAMSKAVFGGLPEGWKVEGDSSGQAVLLRDDRKIPIQLPEVRPNLTRAYRDEQGRWRLLVVHSKGRLLHVVHPDTGKPISRVGTYEFTPVFDLAVSPDQKYLLVAGGRRALRVFALAQPREPLMSVLPDGREWIVWVREGYYAATPGAERLIGWKVCKAEDQLAEFYPLLRFRKKLYRPDVIGQVLVAGGPEEALSAVNEKAADLEELLPPVVSISVRQGGKDEKQVTVEAHARSGHRRQPIEALRLLIDGRPVKDEPVARAATAAVKWPVVVPPGTHEVKVLARCRDVSGLSEAQEVVVPQSPDERPALHLLAVGLNDVGDPKLQVKCARADAEAIDAALGQACVGPGNVFGQARSSSKLLVDEQATAAAVKSALDEFRGKVRPGDLVVFFFAGHGIKEGDQFYLLTHGARLNQLRATALSGDDLRRKLKDFPCHVLLLLDACQSGAAGRVLRNYKPATDDAARALADEECGVTVLAAAMGHERALEPTGSNGLFAAALLGALRGKPGVPYNLRDGRQYVRHLYAYVADEVATASGDLQHPFLSLPWMVESFAVRQIGKPRRKP